ncbi:hypothetical protein H0266_08365 [Halobacillus locisalis]|uniref:Spore coat-associated protein N n=1 Tax=Halobacillus locisalis TaxID=220753 RepID=A0A838CSI6_9BACI|nr:TasA family protein [Halobacillus locisalis]MBA2174904.1 hypothetical protein [Halobacillus locisalis]
MSLKKKLAMGAMTGALGLSLVGGGTYAAFTDTEETTDTYAAGILDIELYKNDMSGVLGSKVFTTELTNFKPGDKITKKIRVTNTGSLSVDRVQILGDYNGFKDGKNLYTNDSASGKSYADDFADMINVTITPTNGNTPYTGTLAQLKAESDLYLGGQQNGSLPKETAGADTIGAYLNDLTDNDPVTITLEFDTEAGNEFQGDAMNVKFKFVASQQEGRDFQDGENVLDLNALEE